MSTDDRTPTGMTVSEAIALRRILRDMQAGYCPCGSHDDAEEFESAKGWKCPSCGFEVTTNEAEAITEAYQPFMDLNVATFQRWRNGRTGKGD